MVRAAGKLAIVLILLPGLGALYQSVSASRDHRRYQPSGRLVAVGGRRLHLVCEGTGAPTVVLEGGLASPALQWALVQEQLRRTNRVCAYDRAGLGWSDSGPEPRTGEKMAAELAALLEQAQVPGPYVLVGHSLGGFMVRLFARDHPTQTAGVVLVAAGNEHDDAKLPPVYREIESKNRQVNRVLGTLARIGVVRIAGGLGMLGSMTGLFRRYPDSLRGELVALTLYSPGYWETATRERAALDATKQEVAGAGSLGSIPLMILSGSPDLSRLPPSMPKEEIARAFRDLQAELTTLSTHSVQITCDSCGHYIPMTQPDLVVVAIRQLLAELPTRDSLR